MMEWTESPALRGHMEAVAACMVAYAARMEPAEAERWFAAGLLHDFDYEKHPGEAEHPFIGVEHLRVLESTKRFFPLYLVTLSTAVLPARQRWRRPCSL